MKKARRYVLWSVMVGVTVLALATILGVGLFGGGLARRAASTPVGALALILIAGGAAVMAPLVLVLKRCTNRPHPPVWHVFRDQNGTAALEMLLVLPFLLMILFMLIQSVFMWNAALVFQYANYATARAAGSVIADDVEASGEGHYMVYDTPGFGEVGAHYYMSPDSVKLWRIRRAAVLALVPISSQIDSTAEQGDPELTGDMLQDMVSRSMSAAGVEEPKWLHQVPGRFRYADLMTDMAITLPDHWKYAEPERGKRCPWHAGLRIWKVSDWQWQPYCPHILEGRRDYAPWESVDIPLSFDYELSVPWAGRVLYQLFRDSGSSIYVEKTTLPGRSTDSYLLRLESKTTFILTG